MDQEKSCSCSNSQKTCPGHDQHLCTLQGLGFHKDDPDVYKTMVNDAQFVCGTCGRTAHEKKNLCDPERL